ncbi:carboxymuconolactone decarboxylase family protein [Psychrobacter sp. FDAARGOS_221]|uniref:carboxymuconolactone decarboxylase family protein n=1 Tax=Psychrobacter sp. FDAARGOS_221 TaxID=1975705 RepID=UPI000BB542ED|nr:carboxymuconolactone decarboxylase family protein [Psychrobacter sp. FDAARGOS_221]PNK60420.1 carboxymuconolactone decarboxylase family protein [Psychrobacter sp. FDAARGOS_221]
MSKSFKDITSHVSKNLAILGKSIPETTKAFSGLAQSVSNDGVLDKKQKELIALAIAVSQRCDACIGFHTKALIKLGATREEIAETLGVCVYMGGGPSYMYAAEAMAAFEEFSA